MSAALLFPVAALVFQAPAQEPRPAEDPGFVIRTETNLALVRFHVIRKNRYVDQIRAEDIQLLEDGAPRKVALFEGPSTGRTVPVEIILLFDVSLSVSNTNLLEGIQETILKGVGDHVSVSVYAFANKLRRFAQATRDVGALKTALDGALDYAHGGTRLYEAITATTTAVAASPRSATRLVLIFSDGQATTKTKPEVAVKAARHFGIPLYPIVLGHAQVVERSRAGRTDRFGMPRPGAIERQGRAWEKESRMAEFAGLGEATGGRSFDPPVMSPLVIREVLQSVVREVQAEYVAGYYPTAGEARRTRKLQVVLRDKNAGKISGGSRAIVY